ncbi:MAG: HIT domain-containing protein [Nanoarchaeota archaeon]
MLSEEQSKQLKSQILAQLENTNIPDKEKIKSQIRVMNSNQLEEFLMQNNLIKEGNEEVSQKCIFCSIISGEIPSHRIEESKEALAVLEINPISKGHILIIPKEHRELNNKLSKDILSLVKKVEKRINTKLKPKNVLTEFSSLFNHGIVNLIPVYDNETSKSKRYSASKEELSGIQILLEKKEKKKVVRVKKPKIKEINSSTKLWLPRRIP